MLVIDRGLALMSLSITINNSMEVDVIWGEEGILSFFMLTVLSKISFLKC